MSVIASPTPSIVELYEEKNRRIYKWISQTPSPSSGGLADAFSPPSTTPTIASLPEEIEKEIEDENPTFRYHSRSDSVSSTDTLLVLDRSLPHLPATHPQQLPLHPPLVPGPIPLPIQPIPISPVQIKPQLASLGPLKQRQLAKPLQLPIPMATHAYPSHQPIVIESPRRHRGHRHHHQHGHDHRDHEYDRDRGHRHHRRRSPSPIRSPVHSSSGTRSRSQPARARHIDETMQLSRDLGADDDKSLVMPPDYHPVSGSGGGSGARTNETSRLSRMMSRMNLSRSRPEGYGGPAEGQPGPINPNAGGGSHSQPSPQSPSQYQQHNPTQAQGHHSHHGHGHGQAPTNRHQNMEQLAGVVASQYIQQHMPSTHHQPHSQHQPSSHHGHHSHHSPGSGSRSRHRSASQSYAQPATYTIQPSHSQAPPTARRPTYTRRRSKSVDERELGTYRSRYPGSPRPSGYHNSPSQQQQVYSHSPPQGYAGSAMGAPSSPIATLPGGGAVVQQTNQPMLVPIDQGRGGWAVVPPAGQEIRVIGSANAHNVVPAVESRTVLRHSSKSRHHRSRSAQPAAEGQGHGGFLKKLFGMGKKSSTSSGGAGGNHNHYAGRGVIQHVQPVQYVDPGRHGGRHGEREREKERNGERAHRRRRRESY